MSSTERAFHDSLKPRWGPDGILVYAASARPLSKSSRRNRERDGLLVVQKGGVISEGRDVRFANFSNEVSNGIGRVAARANQP
jgi:nuclear pore complex protein Nup98-Nup96